MKKLILIIALFSSFHAFGQGLEIEESFFSTSYYKDGVSISQSKFKEYLYSNEESKNLYKAGKQYEVAAYIFSISSGVFLGTYLGQHNRNTNNLYASLGSFAIALVLSDAANKKIKKSLRIYNNGIGLTYQF